MNHQEYLTRMKKSPQFSIIGVNPKWVPGTRDIEGFIHDEVVRQFHDPRVKEDGGMRIYWMRNAWGYALHQTEKPTIHDIIRVGNLVEPEYNAPTRFRTTNVSIGAHVPPHWEDVPKAMANLFATVHQVEPKQGQTDFYRTQGYGAKNPTADDFYLEFEAIHPFLDGNGRSGKILHNWLLGTLEDPVLVDDYFNGGNP